jgi:hypothetical protein
LLRPSSQNLIHNWRRRRRRRRRRRGRRRRRVEDRERKREKEQERERERARKSQTESAFPDGKKERKLLSTNLHCSTNLCAQSETAITSHKSVPRRRFRFIVWGPAKPSAILSIHFLAGLCRFTPNRTPLGVIDIY